MFAVPVEQEAVWVESPSQAALEEAESALEQEENKVLRSQLELSQVKQEIERRIKEKEEELEGLRKTHQRAIESMQSSLETETKAKGEAIRHKKKLEADLNELDIALEHANGANSEAQQTIKKYQNNIKLVWYQKVNFAKYTKLYIGVWI